MSSAERAGASVAAPAPALTSSPCVEANLAGSDPTEADTITTQDLNFCYGNRKDYWAVSNRPASARAGCALLLPPILIFNDPRLSGNVVRPLTQKRRALFHRNGKEFSLSSENESSSPHCMVACRSPFFNIGHSPHRVQTSLPVAGIRPKCSVVSSARSRSAGAAQDGRRQPRQAHGCPSE